MDGARDSFERGEIAKHNFLIAGVDYIRVNWSHVGSCRRMEKSRIGAKFADVANRVANLGLRCFRIKEGGDGFEPRTWGGRVRVAVITWEII